MPPADDEPAMHSKAWPELASSPLPGNRSSADRSVLKPVSVAVYHQFDLNKLGLSVALAPFVETARGH